MCIRDSLQVAQMEQSRGRRSETAAVATAGSQGATRLKLLLQMLRKSHHPKQPSKKATPMGRPDNKVETSISPERDP